MDNSAIADNFSLLSKLIDIHGDDSFKAKSYGAASFTIDKLTVQLSELSPEKIFAIKGIGQASGKKILEQLETGHLQALEDYLMKTPPGVLELLNIKGLGPKKIATVWKELGIESVGELLYACDENRLTLYKGFGEKTQQNIRESINFYMASQGHYLYGQIESFALAFTEKLSLTFPTAQFLITGHFKRQMEVIDKLEWVTDSPAGPLLAWFSEMGYNASAEDNLLSVKGPENVTLEFLLNSAENLINTAFQKNCSPEFLQAWQTAFPASLSASHADEQSFFASAGLPFIPVSYREKESAIDEAKNNQLPDLIGVSDIKGIIHSHSTWSDGNDTLEAMAQQAIAKGFEYLVISDHSQSAFYASGLQPDRIKAQHAQIDELNARLHPFKIFKSIEADILNDGSLDYTDDILASFDLVIASVHSNLTMSEEKAMMRLMKAIENPFTTILGHMTGRLLLSRNGYPVNHELIIEACKKHNVVIELNAHSRRLDMDWRYIRQATDAGVLISIDPDAHSIKGFDDIRYGVLVAQKAGLTATQNLSSFNRAELEAYIAQKKSK